MRTKNQLKDGMLDAKGLDIISRRRLRTIRSDYHVLGDTKLGRESGGSILHDGVVVLGSLGDALGLGNHDVGVGDVIIRDVAAADELGSLVSNGLGDLLGRSAVIIITLPAR